MSKVKDFYHDEFDSIGEHNRFLINKKYENIKFGNFVVGQNSFYKEVLMDEVYFNNCSVSNSSVCILGEVKMKSVTFRNMDCHEYIFTPENKLDGVKIIGGKKSTLWMRPARTEKGVLVDDVKLEHPEKDDGICIDISDFKGSVVLGDVYPKNIIIDKSRHAILSNNEKYRSELNGMTRSVAERLYYRAKYSSTGCFISSIDSLE